MWRQGQVHTYRVPQLGLAANYNSQQAFLPGRLSPSLPLGAHALADVAPGTRRRGAAGSGGGIWTRRSCRRGSPSGDRSPRWAAAAGMARAGPAWLLLLAIWVRLWYRGSGRASTCAPCAGPRFLPLALLRYVGRCLQPPGWERACQTGRDPAAAGEAAGRPPCPPGRSLQSAGVGGSPGELGDFWQAACVARTTLRGRKSRGGHRLGRDTRGLGDAQRTRLRALHLCECGVGKRCFPPALPETLF